MPFTDFELSFSFDAPFLILGAIILIVYTIMIYRITIPTVSKTFKSVLTFFRASALILILMAIFEPVLTLIYNEIIEPEHLVFIDNSSSMAISDSQATNNNIGNFLKQIESSANSKTSFYLFGETIEKLESNDSEHLNFNEKSTNFQTIFDNFDISKRNVASFVVISDGNFNTGNSPIYSAETIGVPIFTIGVGDTTQQKDVWISKIQYNNYIYADKETIVNAVINNIEFSSKPVVISFYEDLKLLNQEKIILGQTGINKVQFAYTPTEPGERKLTISISGISNETTTANNKKTVYVNVLNNKLQILLVGGTPSADLTAIKNSLEYDVNLEVNRIIQIAPNKFLDETNKSELLDNSDILFLIGFPSSSTSYEFLSQIKIELESNNKPFFILVNNDTDILKLKILENRLSFNFNQIVKSYQSIQPIIAIPNNPIIKNGIGDITKWENLPPIVRNSTMFSAKPNTETLAEIKVKNIHLKQPLISSIKQGNRQSIAVIAGDIWRWKLQAASKADGLFDTFLQNCVKWLNTTSEQKPVTIKPTKRIFQNGELVEFSGQIYDETFTSIENAEVNVTIKSNDKNFETILSSIGNGIYEGSFDAPLPGDYTYKASAIVENQKVGQDNGRFTVSAVDIEQLSPKANTDLLKLMATVSKGKYAYLNDAEKIIDMLNEKSISFPSKKKYTESYDLWADEWLLFIIVILFALEWFYRKRAGML